MLGQHVHRRSGQVAVLLRGSAFLFGLAAISCRPGPWDPLHLGSSLIPFERLPYVQGVDTIGAWILWRADATARDSFLFRIRGQTEWRSAAVERHPVRDRPQPPDASLPDSWSDRRVRLTDLPPGTEVEYLVYADTVRIGPATVRTAPRPREAGEVRVLAFGDSGWGSESQLLLAGLMEDHPWDLIVHTGDIAYGKGSELDFTVRHFQVYRKLLASVPFFPSPGNHDIDSEGGQPYDRAFVWPIPRPGARYYTFRWGNVRFFALDSSSEEAGAELRRADGPQYEWLVAALDSASREEGVDWTVAFMHHPIYSHPTGLAGKGSDSRLQASLAPLFQRFGVDLVLTGHDHHYERSRPIRDGQVVTPGCGPVYVVTGGGGGSFYARGVAPPSILTATILREYHFLNLRITAEAIEGRAIGVEGQTLDTFRIRPFAGESAAGAQCEKASAPRSQADAVALASLRSQADAVDR